MRTRLNLFLLGVILLTALGVGFGAAELSRNVFSLVLERRIQQTHLELQNKFRSFDLFMRKLEEKLDQRLTTILPGLAERIAQRGDPRQWRPDELQALAAEFQVRDIYLIGPDLVVFNTTFPPDQGLDLGLLSPELKQRLSALLHSGRLEIDRISMSSKTGIIKKYAYTGRVGDGYLVEASINMWEGATLFGSEAEKRFFLEEVFQGLVDSSDILREMDLFIADDQAQWSLLHEGRAMDPAIARQLRDQAEVALREGERLTVYTHLPRLDTISGFRYFGKTVFTTALPEALSLGIFQRTVWVVALVSLLTFLLAERIIHRWLIQRVQTIDAGVTRIARGDFATPIAIANGDEMGRIGAAIDAMATCIQQREQELQAAKQELEQRVAERTRALRESLATLAASEANYRFVVENARSIILRWRPDGAITFCNEFGHALFGYAEPGLVGRSVFDTIVPPTEANGRDLHTRLREIAAAPQRHAHHENENLCRDGRRVWISWANRGIVGPSGAETEILSVGLDITHLKAIERELILARDDANAANQAKSEFLAIMSHEIRTPMNVILGIGDLLADAPFSPDQRQLLELSNNAGRHLLSLINDILDLAKVEAGRVTLEQRPIPLPEMLAETHQLLAVRAAEKGLAMTLVTEPGLPTWVTGDYTRLRQVLVNLLGNAIKFTDQGQITLTAGPDPHGAGVLISIADTGIGIAPEHLSLVFDKFTQADASITRRFGGTGLGLALSRRLVELMEGRIWVTSEEGMGSTFHLKLPMTATPGPEPAVPTPAPALPPSLAPLRILLAEDKEDNQLLIQAFLKGTPHQLTVAKDGAEAVARVQQADFDLLLLDVQMPVMDGYAAARAIRHWERQTNRPRLAIATLTAHVLDGERERSQAAGCDLFLTKPIDRLTLLTTLQQVALERLPT